MRNRWNILAFTVMGLVFAGMSLYLILHPDRTGVVPNYRNASTHWWASQNLYEEGTHGFLYAPSFAVLFTPFNLLRPTVLGEILWRFFGFGLFGWALWRLSDFLQVQDGRSGLSAPAFWGMVLLSVPASLASLNNGQTNLALSAVLILAALSLRGEKWPAAGFYLNAALILKPIALAPWLLAFAVFSPMRGYLLLGMVGALGLEFAHADPSYAWHQTGEFFHKLLHSYSPENLRVSDIFGALDKAKVSISAMMEKGLRVAACLAALIYLCRAERRRGPASGGWVLWVVSALIFTILNPRAETNSYVLISPLLAFAAVSYLREVEGGKWKGAILALACLGLMCDGMGKPIYLATDVWLKPSIVLLVSPLLFRMPVGWKLKY